MVPEEKTIKVLKEILSLIKTLNVDRKSFKRMQLNFNDTIKWFEYLKKRDKKHKNKKEQNE